MTHQIMQSSAALLVCAPEPRRMGPAMFFCGASEIRSAGRRGPAAPQQFASGMKVRREHLVLEVAMHQADSLDQLGHAFCFGESSCKGFFASDPPQGSLAALERLDDLFDVLDPRMIRAGQPDRIDGRIRHHVANGRVGPRFADVEAARERCRRSGMLRIGAANAADFSVTDGAKGLHVKARVEPASYEAHTETASWCSFSCPDIHCLRRARLRGGEFTDSTDSVSPAATATLDAAGNSLDCVPRFAANNNKSTG